VKPFSVVEIMWWGSRLSGGGHVIQRERLLKLSKAKDLGF
jgi:hypothetical protein